MKDIMFHRNNKITMVKAKILIYNQLKTTHINIYTYVHVRKVL